MTDPIPLEELSRALLAAAGESGARRSSRTVVGGRDYVMRQTLIALLADGALAEHESPGEATLHVLQGHVALESASASAHVRAGDLVEIPQERHSLRALEDSVVLLTAVPREHVAPTA